MNPILATEPDGESTARRPGYASSNRSSKQSGSQGAIGGKLRKRVSVLALVMAALPALVFAYPGFGGGKGLFRVQNAMVEPEAGLTISLSALARNTD